MEKVIKELLDNSYNALLSKKHNRRIDIILSKRKIHEKIELKIKLVKVIFCIILVMHQRKHSNLLILKCIIIVEIYDLYFYEGVVMLEKE